MNVGTDNSKKFQEWISRLNIFQQSPTIYDSIGGTPEYGPYGATMKQNMIQVFRETIRKEGFWEVDLPIISPKMVWEASGHTERFYDIIAKSGEKTFRVDQVLDSLGISQKPDFLSLESVSKYLDENSVIPQGESKPLTNPQTYSLMVHTKVNDRDAILRPETATTTYLAFKDTHRLLRETMPLSLFQTGRSFRNEITSRQGLIRSREFEQFEGQTFIHQEHLHDFPEYDRSKNTGVVLFWNELQKKGDAPKQITLDEAVKQRIIQNQAYATQFHIAKTLLDKLNIPLDRIRFRQHQLEEKAHYAADAWDLEVNTQQFGWVEICGIHDRGTYDLERHSKYSGKNLSVKNSKNSYETPRILEVAFGVGRTFYSMLENVYEIRDNKSVLNLAKGIEPIKATIAPLSKKPELVEIAKELYHDLKQNSIVTLDVTGSIGKRYARADELGTPYVVTVDFDSLQDNKATIRYRTSSHQERIPISEISTKL